MPLKAAMRIVWERRNADSSQVVGRLQTKLEALTTEKDNLIRSIDNNPALAQDIAESVTKIKFEIEAVEQQLVSAKNTDKDFNEFMDFSLDYVDDLNANWWTLTPDRRERCKQLSFPKGIFITQNITVSTPEISVIYRYGSMKNVPQWALCSGDGDPC